MKKPLACQLSVAVASVSLLHAGTQVIVDANFDPQLNSGGVVYSIALAPDGNIVIGGEFHEIGEAPAVRVARLHPDGALDLNFDVGAGPDATVRAVEVNSAGEVFIGGNFQNVDGVASPNIARLLVGGPLDTTFTLGSGPSGGVNCIGFTSDDALYFGGSFLNVNGVASVYVGRVDGMGAPIEGFDCGLEHSFSMEAGVTALALQPDGRVVLGGNFNAENGFRTLARLLPDGSLDDTFSGQNGPVLYVNKITVLADGRLLVAGTSDASGSGFIRRLNSDGTVDSTFAAPSMNGAVYSFARLGNGQILVGGAFSTVNGAARNSLVRLEANGSLDTNFNVAANGVVTDIEATSDGKIIVGGAFTEIGGVSRNGIARLREQPFALHAMSATSGQFIARLQVQPGKTYVVESSADLNDWSTFSTNTATNLGLEINDAAARQTRHRFFRARLAE